MKTFSSNEAVLSWTTGREPGHHGNGQFAHRPAAGHVQKGSAMHQEHLGMQTGAAREKTIDPTLRSASVAFGNNLGEKSPARNYDD